MASIKEIKQARDCVVTHVYEKGHLVSIRYNSKTMGEAEEHIKSNRQEPEVLYTPKKRREE